MTLIQNDDWIRTRALNAGKSAIIKQCAEWGIDAVNNKVLYASLTATIFALLETNIEGKNDLAGYLTSVEAIDTNFMTNDFTREWSAYYDNLIKHKKVGEELGKYDAQGTLASHKLFIIGIEAACSVLEQTKPSPSLSATAINAATPSTENVQEL